MDLDEVVCEVAERNRCCVVLDLFRECVRQSRIPAVRHADREIVSLNKTRADVLRIRRSDQLVTIAADALRWAVALF